MCHVHSAGCRGRGASVGSITCCLCQRREPPGRAQRCAMNAHTLLCEWFCSHPSTGRLYKSGLQEASFGPGFPCISTKFTRHSLPSASLPRGFNAARRCLSQPRCRTRAGLPFLPQCPNTAPRLTCTPLDFSLSLSFFNYYFYI